MIIKRFEVVGLSGREGVISRVLNDDINILTGRNGSGKTTLLKLLWYIISGNIEHAIREVAFSRAIVQTSEYTITIQKKGGGTCEIEFVTPDGVRTFEDRYDDEGEIVVDAEDQANEVVKDFSSSVFFPTFRRIEGGFSLNSRRMFTASGRMGKARSELEEAMSELSRRMSVSNHTFVASISTTDIVSLLMRQYTEMSELSNNLQQKTSQSIIDRIKDYKYDSRNDVVADTAESVLDNIRTMIECMDRDREALLAPLNAVKTLAEKLFRHSGIMLNSRISFGDAANAISSETLSAGEKQMLSFICYNAFYKNSMIFIDEPELSLHVDWQRQLFPIMQAQESSNQFIIATHSPFIYSKYPEKEIIINDDRGDGAGANG